MPLTLDFVIIFIQSFSEYRLVQMALLLPAQSPFALQIFK
jgi:hypothetical protein